jgi:VanZ family protein
VLCATPGNLIPSANWLELLSFDKLVHASMFFSLCSLLFLVVLKNNQNSNWLIIYFFASIFYGALLELMQAYCFVNRSADWLDIIANSFGCVLALVLFKRLKLFFKTA